MDGLASGTSGIIATDLQDLSAAQPNSAANNPGAADVLTAAGTVSPEEAANAVSSFFVASARYRWRFDESNFSVTRHL